MTFDPIVSLQCQAWHVYIQYLKDRAESAVQLYGCGMKVALLPDLS